MLLNNPNFAIQRTSTIYSNLENGSGIMLPVITEERDQNGENANMIGGILMNQDLLDSSILYSNNVSDTAS